MNLREYLDDNILEIRHFTKKIRVSEHTVYNWLRGAIIPLRINQLKIQKITKGKVTTEDWGKHERTKKVDRRERSAKDNEVRPAQHLDANKKIKLKIRKKGA